MTLDSFEKLMTQKTILITGCSTGIGHHAAITLAQQGYRVFASARNHDDLSALRELGIETLELDLAVTSSISHAVNTLLSKTGGRLDYLFNNGAYGQPGAIEDLPTDALRQQFETNVFGWHELTRQIIPVMREQGHGRIIQNSSVLGFVCMSYRGAYNASKYALEALTDTLRMELMATNIQVVLIEPGPINSQFRANAYAAFKKHINYQNSQHQLAYDKQMQRLSSRESSTGFTLEPEAVTKALLHALESKQPKIRYRVTFPTKLFHCLKRVLPSRWLDKLLARG